MTTDVDVHSATAIQELTDLVTPWAMRVAATLRLADHMIGGATTVEELASRASAAPDTTRRLLEHLTARGVFSRVAPDRYEVTEVGALLCEDHPASVRQWLDVEGGMGGYDKALIGLLEAVRTGRGVYEALFGTSFFDDLNSTPERAAAYDRLMATLTTWTLPDIVGGYDWSGVKLVVDVAGGTGALLAGVLTANPHLAGILVDDARAIDTARETFAGAGLSDRTTLVAGSMFDPLPPGADVYTIKSTVMGWGDEDATRVLRNCAEAAGPGGRVVIAEFLRNEPRLVPSLDLYMALLGGKERTRQEFDTIAGTAGLTPGSATTTPSGYWLLEYVVA
jgi:SAM-dependent methyltransferase